MILRKQGVFWAILLAFIFTGCVNPVIEATPTGIFTTYPLPTFTPANTPTRTITVTPDRRRTKTPAPSPSPKIFDEINEYRTISSDEWTVFFFQDIGIQYGSIFNKIVIAPDNTVWISTSSSLVKYANGKWEEFALDEDLHIRDMVLAKGETIWARVCNYRERFCDSVARFDGKAWTYYKVPFQDLQTEEVSYFGVATDGTVWVSSERHSYSMDHQGNWNVFRNIYGYFAESPNKELWLRGVELLWRFDSSKWQATSFVEPVGQSQNWRDRLWLKFAQDGSMWFIKDTSYVRILPNQERKSYLTYGAAPPGYLQIIDMNLSPKGDLWLVGFDKAIFLLTDDKWIKFKVKGNLDILLSVAESPNGDVWMGGSAGHIYLYRPKH